MTVENDWRRKWRMPTELCRSHAPNPDPRCENSSCSQRASVSSIPNGDGNSHPTPGLGTSHQDEKHPLADFCFLQVFLGHPVFVFSRPAIHHRNPVGSRIAPQATTESPCQSHQMRFVQSLIASR